MGLNHTCAPACWPCEHYNREIRVRGVRRTGAMFRGSASTLRIDAGESDARIGWGGRVASILRVHQEGLLDRVTPRGPLYQYPARVLLGRAGRPL